MAEPALGVRRPSGVPRVSGEVVRGPATTTLIDLPGPDRPATGLVRTLMQRLRRACALAVVVALMPAAVVIAAGGGGGSGSGSEPGPASQGSGAVTHGRLVAGAGGTYLPIIPADIVPLGPELRNPLETPPAGANPQGMTCPASRRFHTGPGGVVLVITIQPTFTRNATGGYDGADARFGYAIANAIPPGGDPTAVTPGSPATAANVAGHVIAVTAFVLKRGTWQDAQPVAPYGGSCQGTMFSFSTPYLAGNAPSPVPPASVLRTPPFPTGADLVTGLTKSWRVGAVETLPGASPTSRTFVHIPTCAWTDSSVPVAPDPFHALTTTVVGGYTLFLLYEVTVIPGTVAWSWGDGTSTIAPGPVERGPAQLPSYDPGTQRWSDPCGVSHEYAGISAGATITATESFTVTITVSWSDGVAVHTLPVACDAASGGACSLTLGPADGWQSGPHPVDQIEPVPLQAPSPTP